MSDDTENLPALDGDAYRPSRFFLPARFDFLMKWATVLVDSGLVPDSLRATGSGDSKKDLPREKILANCFMVCDFAEQLGIAPGPALASSSIVHGKLGFEGKLIAAAIAAKLGIKLEYEWAGNGDNMSIKVFDPGKPEHFITGTVAEWKTTKVGTPWVQKNYKKMLAYRGTREWGRIYSPGIMTGILSDDELLEIAEDVRAQRAQDVTNFAGRYTGRAASGAGFHPDNVRAIEQKTAVPMGAIGAHDPQPVVANGGGRHEAVTQAPNCTTEYEHAAAGASGQAGEMPATDSDPLDAAGTATSDGLASVAEGSSDGAGGGVSHSHQTSPPSSSENRPAGSLGGGGGGAEATSGVAAPNFHGYHLALQRASQWKSLLSLDAGFRKEQAWTSEESHLEKLRAIFALHGQRVRQEITAKQFLDGVKELRIQ